MRGGEKMKVTKTLQYWLFDKNKMPPPTSDQIHVLVVIPKQESSAASSQIFMSYRPYAEGINVQLPHLSRDLLVEKLHDAVLSTNFVLLSSPAGSGKTSLLTLFAVRHPDIRCVPISLNHSTATASDLISQHGIDVLKQTCRLVDDGRHFLFMLDDAQRQYHDQSFWNLLIKGSSSWLPPSVRFIISATHSLESEASDSPVVFQSFLRKFMRKDFLVNNEEAIQLFEMDNGLPASMRYPTLEQVIIGECLGHIGSLRVVIDTIASYFEKVKHTEQDLLTYFFSDNLHQAMHRIFGKKHSEPSTSNLRDFLIKCLIRESSHGLLTSQWNADETHCLARLMKAGIITQELDCSVKFTSPLAEKYYCKWLFPNRGHDNPSSLYDLIRKVIGNMSASVLRQSIVGKNDFPKEATFQHQFMEGLALYTHPTCSICPELSRVFPASPRQRDQRIDEEIDFYLNGSLRWGVELLVKGDKIGEQMARFSSGGKYAALAAREYAVVDFRVNKSGKVTNIARKPERICVFFKLGDFSSCRCVFGLEEDSDPIVLKH